jgi:hypothetical protein
MKFLLVGFAALSFETTVRLLRLLSEGNQGTMKQESAQQNASLLRMRASALYILPNFVILSAAKDLLFVMNEKMQKQIFRCAQDDNL